MSADCPRMGTKSQEPTDNDVRDGSAWGRPWKTVQEKDIQMFGFNPSLDFRLGRGAFSPFGAGQGCSSPEIEKKKKKRERECHVGLGVFSLNPTRRDLD